MSMRGTRQAAEDRARTARRRDRQRTQAQRAPTYRQMSKANRASGGVWFRNTPEATIRNIAHDRDGRFTLIVVNESARATGVGAGLWRYSHQTHRVWHVQNFETGEQAARYMHNLIASGHDPHPGK